MKEIIGIYDFQEDPAIEQMRQQVEEARKETEQVREELQEKEGILETIQWDVERAADKLTELFYEVKDGKQVKREVSLKEFVNALGSHKFYRESSGCDMFQYFDKNLLSQIKPEIVTETIVEEVMPKYVESKIKDAIISLQNCL